jgi:lanosterol synthase
MSPHPLRARELIPPHHPTTPPPPPPHQGYLYGVRFQAHLTDVTRSLREELYLTPYKEIAWPQYRNFVAPTDLITPHTAVFDFVNVVLGGYELVHSTWAREQSLAHCLELIEAEDVNTNSLDLGPVNKVMNTLVIWLTRGRDSPAFLAHLDRLQDFMWMGRDGLMMNGTNGSQLWDTAFAVQAALATGLCGEGEGPFAGMLTRALAYLDHCQIQGDARQGRCYRHTSRGAWPFSTREQSYTVSDCTAEGLKSVLALQRTLPYAPQRVGRERLCDAADVLLSMQNQDGGWASYELVRAPAWLEWLNPAEVFSNIMTDYSYPECTTAACLGLKAFAAAHPEHRGPEVQRALARGVRYVRRKQRPDGSWYGSWGICFTYATWFAVECLVSVAGESYATSPAVRRACDFLIGKQAHDGGWGECYTSCTAEAWVPHATSQVTQTSWALLTLMSAKYPGRACIRKGVRLLMHRQRASGEWAQESIEGVFNKVGSSLGYLGTLLGPLAQLALIPTPPPLTPHSRS